MNKIKRSIDTVRYISRHWWGQLLITMILLALFLLLGNALVSAQEAGNVPVLQPLLGPSTASNWEIMIGGAISGLIMLGGQLGAAWKEASKTRANDLERMREERDQARGERDLARERALRAEVRLEIRDQKGRADD